MHAGCARVVKLLDALALHDTTPIPETVYVLPGDYLSQPARLDMSDFDEGVAEEKDVGCMPSCVGRDALPLERWRRPGWCAAFVDIQAKVCRIGLERY